MRYPAEETEEKHRRILEEASRAFRTYGFAGVSISDIMKATGLTHGPFYNHFSSKNSLVEEVVRQTTGQLETDFSNLAREGGNAEIHRHYVSKSHRDEPAYGCMLAACAPEISRESSFRSVAAQHIEKTIKTIETGSQSNAHGTARDVAIAQFAAMVGSIILSRACAGSPLSDEVLDATLKQLGRAAVTEKQSR